MHITKLTQGDQVKIVIRPNYQLEIVNNKNGSFLKPGRIGRMARGSTRTIVFGSIITNDSENGNIELNVADPINKIISATVPYNYIRTIQKIVPFETSTETSNPTRPGGKALGTNLPGNILLTPRFNLITVKF